MEKVPNILLLDDTKTQLVYIEDLIKRSGFNVVGTDNLIDFHKHLENNKFDLILLDVILPNTDGYKICKGLKSDSRYHNIPVIFITSLTKDTEVIKGLEAGAEDFITKPFNEQILLLRINSVLSKFSRNDKYCSLYRQSNELNLTQEEMLQLRKMTTLRSLSAGLTSEINKPLNCIGNDISALKEQYNILLNYIEHLNLIKSNHNLIALLAYINKNEKNIKQAIEFTNTVLENLTGAFEKTSEIIDSMIELFANSESS